MTKLNISFIQIIEINIKVPVPGLKFVDRPATLFHKANCGFVDSEINHTYSFDDIKRSKTMYHENLVVYYYPYIKFTMVSGEVINKWFESEEELNTFLIAHTFINYLDL